VNKEISNQEVENNFVYFCIKWIFKYNKKNFFMQKKNKLNWKIFIYYKRLFTILHNRRKKKDVGLLNLYFPIWIFLNKIYWFLNGIHFRKYFKIDLIDSSSLRKELNFIKWRFNGFNHFPLFSGLRILSIENINTQ
jgi:hypothetical protein